MSIFLEFPSIEDYPIYSTVDNAQEGGLIPAAAFNWLMTLQFSALKSPEISGSTVNDAAPDDLSTV
ncbi:MAG TPA: hypothetical protein VK541_21805 [Pedobacter sp.]|uniref:hypothetical protein n=1 Tax=Pedobacter sp. TaxID=1411316 RepID=UPI002BF1ECA9|nr:hypothetical protein [Pedobacter sp.]HMI05137.1 hypothetical protein [Pedobacter sp.]